MTLIKAALHLRRAAIPTLYAATLLAGACSTPPGTSHEPVPASGEPALGTARSAGPRATPTLYDQLGGAAGVDRLTTDFIRELAADDRVRGRYAKSDINRFHRMMKQQMCMKTGGGCTYEGDDMKRTHAGMNINRIEFNAVVEALMRAMDKNDVSQSAQNQLLATYAPMRKDIIEQ